MGRDAPIRLALSFAVSLNYAAPVVASNAAERGVACAAGIAFNAISLDEALRTAVSQNPRLASAREDEAKSKADVTTSIAAFMPSLSASLQGERFLNEAPGANAVTTVGSTVVGGQADRYTNYPSVSANWNLFNGGKDVAAYRAAQAELRASGKAVASELNDTLTSVLSAYNDLLKAQLALAQQQRAVATRDSLLTRAEQRYRGSNGTLIDVSRARIARLQAERDAAKGCRTVLDKSAALAQAAGLRVSADDALQVVGVLPPGPPAQLDDMTLDAAVEIDPAVVAARERRAAAVHRVSEARSVLLPTLALVARYDWLGQREESYSYAWHDTTDNSYRYGFVFQQALFPFVSYQGAIGSARADAGKAEAAYRDATLTAATRLRGALSAKGEADAAAESTKRSAADADGILTLSQALFARGHADLDTVDRARLDADSAAEAAQEAAYDQALSGWMLYRSVYPADFATDLLQSANRAAGVR